MEKIREIKFNHERPRIIWRDDSDQSVIDEIFVDRMYRSTEYLISNIKYPILDIGAHIGLFSIYARLLNLKIKIIALEPEPNNFALMKKNLKLNRIKNIITKQIALTDSDASTAELYLSKNSHNHSTVKQFNNLTIKQSGSQTITVPAISMPQIIKKYKLETIGLLKMDIEGGEFEIARHMEYGTWNKIRYAAIEYHESEDNKRAGLENIIRQHGFSVEHFPNLFDKRFGLLLCRNKN